MIVCALCLSQKFHERNSAFSLFFFGQSDISFYNSARNIGLLFPQFETFMEMFATSRSKFWNLNIVNNLPSPEVDLIKTLINSMWGNFPTLIIWSSTRLFFHRSSHCIYMPDICQRSFCKKAIKKERSASAFVDDISSSVVLWSDHKMSTVGEDHTHSSSHAQIRKGLQKRINVKQTRIWVPILNIGFFFLIMRRVLIMAFNRHFEVKW